MKTFRFLFISLLSLIPCLTFAQDRIGIKISDEEVGKTIKMDVQFNNESNANYTAFQMDIVIPEGFSYVDESLVPGIRLLTHIVSSSQQSENILRVSAFSPQNMEISGTSGSLFSIILTSQESTLSGNYRFATQSSTFVKRNGVERKLNNPHTDFTFNSIADTAYFDLTYIVDGAEYKKVRLRSGTRISAISAPQKEGHQFKGWKDLPRYMPRENLTVTAEYTVNSYTITYILNGEVYKKQTVKYGEKIIPPAVNTEEGEEFSGWESLPETMPAENLFIHGKTSITGIEEFEAEARYDVYNLQGVRVLSRVTLHEAKNKLPRGVYAVNGKKLFIK